MELGYFTLPAGEKLAERHSVRVGGDIPELTPGLDVYQWCMGANGDRGCSKGDHAGNQVPEARHGSTLGAG